MQTLPITHDAAASSDIDWELLLLLARTEAALTWPDLAEDANRNPTLPDGLDLRHGADFDWVSRVVANAAATLCPLVDGPYSSTK